MYTQDAEPKIQEVTKIATIGGRNIGRLQLMQLLVGAAVMLVAMIVVMASMGRRWWCACGSWSPASWDIWSSHNSQHLVDPYFFSHFLHGIIFFGFLQIVAGRAAMATRVMLAMAIEVGWELLENSPLIINRYREATISLDYFGDSIANSLVDDLPARYTQRVDG